MCYKKDYDYIEYDEYLDNEKGTGMVTEYSDGVIFYNPPNHIKHNRLTRKLHSIFYANNGRNLNECLMVFMNNVSVTFEVSGAIKHQFYPDIVIKGAKDRNILIVEVLSRATKERDLGLKLDVYEKFEVGEYWIVDISKGIITVYSDNYHRMYCEKRIYFIGDCIKWNNCHIHVEDLFAAIN